MAGFCASLRSLNGSSRVCNRCAFRAICLPALPKTQRRNISQNWIKKQAAADQQWEENAKEVAAGRKQSFLDFLDSRGFVHSVAGDRKLLDDILTQRRTGVYAGIDPTGPSMHVGHLLHFMVLFWCYIHGYTTVHLIGSATAKIGDPTGRLKTRDHQASSIRKANLANMHYQIKALWRTAELHATKYGYKRINTWRRAVTNNAEWWNSQTLVEVMQILGPGVRIGEMLGKETVRNKMEKGDGMSFAEFVYPLMQSWDFWQLNQKLKIQVEIGGADQYGNIMAGVDAVKYIINHHSDPEIRGNVTDLDNPIGFTVPLLTTASGEKFGKSAGNAVWLDKEMTSTFDLYQYFLRTADADVERYLKLFTLLPLTDISTIMAEHNADPSQRKAQHKLAYECLCLIHGHQEALSAYSQHRRLFPRPGPGPLNLPEIKNVKAAEPTDPNAIQSCSLNKYAPQSNMFNRPSVNMILPRSLVEGRTFAKILWSAGLVSSKSEGHRLCVNQGAYVGSRPEGHGRLRDDLAFAPIKLYDPRLTQEYIIDDDLLILRVGKWKLKVIKVVSDEEYMKSGENAPGWDEFMEEQQKEPEPVIRKVVF